MQLHMQNGPPEVLYVRSLPLYALGLLLYEKGATTVAYEIRHEVESSYSTIHSVIIPKTDDLGQDH